MEHLDKLRSNFLINRNPEFDVKQSKTRFSTENWAIETHPQYDFVCGPFKRGGRAEIHKRNGRVNLQNELKV